MSASTRTSTRRSAVDAVGRSLDAIAADRRPGIWIELVPAAALLAEAREVDRRVGAGEHLPLAGLTFAVKNNIDLAGVATTAGCPSYGSVPDDSAPVVRALQAAGAIAMGATNLDQFATGLTGVCSPYGVCPNAHWPELISGGSSSGSAVAVAAGLVDFALGTDTAGSGRVPAAMNGIVGIKPTKGRLSTRGVVPACRSLDCVSVFALDVSLARAVADLAAGFDADDPWSRRAPSSGLDCDAPDRALRLGVPMIDDALAGPGGNAGFVAAVAALATPLGADLVSVDPAPFIDAGRLLYDGAFVAERVSAVGSFVLPGDGRPEPEGLDPAVAGVIRRAAALPASQLFDDLTRLRELRVVSDTVWESCDVLVVPTVPRCPSAAEAIADPRGVSAELGIFTNFVNLLDLAAVAFPTGPRTSFAAGRIPDEPPRSLTVIGPAWSDDVLARIAEAGAIRTAE